MDNINEIKAQLDKYYQEYKDNKNTLNGGKTKNVARLIVDIVFSKDGNPHDAATELARFSAEVSANFFDTLTNAKTLPLQAIEDVLKELLATDTDPKLSQYYVSKFAPAIVSIIRCYKDEANRSSILPKLVVFMARFAIKSDKNKNKFYNLINNSAGEIFKLDYSSISKKSLINIWNAINGIYPDLAKAKYEPLISEWGRKYGFIKDTTPEAPVKIEEVIVANEATAGSTQSDQKQEAITSNKPETNSASEASTPSDDKREDKTPAALNVDNSSTAEKPAEKGEESIKNDNTSAPTPDKARPKSTGQVLYERIKKDIDKEQEAIITAFTDIITPVGKAFESIQGEISKSREIGAENVSLKAKVADLERQLSEQRDRFQMVNQSLMASRTENEELKIKVTALESQNAELDSKLNDAYAINSRESSLEAEKIRSELKKAFAFLYEDWLEYEFSDVSEDNYESLQAIIKKIFRSLERNGIDFKGNN